MKHGEKQTQLNYPNKKLSYCVVSKRMPEPCIFFKTYDDALHWAKNDQPAYRPFYILERTEYFEICGVVK